MVSFRSVPAAAALATALSLTLTPGAFAQEKNDRKQQEKLQKEQRQQYEAMAALVDAAAAGTPRSDFTVRWASDFSLKAQDERTYVPFTITVDTASAPSSAVMYVRVVTRGAAAEPPKDADKDGDKKQEEDAPAYPFEDLYTVQLQGSPARVSRALAVPAGDYDVYVALAENKGTSKDKMAVGRASVLKQPVTVPDYWKGDLAASPVVVAEKIERLAAPLSDEERMERPYVLGDMEITPSADKTLSKKENLSLIFLIYNPQSNETGKPDLEVQYSFNQKTGDTEKFFNRTNPQLFNGSTLPPQFDVRAGHQVVAGQEIPLASFPEGEYRLEIKINDKLSGKSLTKDVGFTVTP